MNKEVYIVCGVPGSGKTWVCKQVAAHYAYVPHDAYIGGDLVQALKAKSLTSDKPLLTECPFGERVLRDKLLNHGFTVHPVFVVEHVAVIKSRYEPRGRPTPKAHVTRAGTIAERAKEWGAPHGTSSEMAAYLGERRNG